MGHWSYKPTYRSYNPICNWKGAHLVPVFGGFLDTVSSVDFCCGCWVKRTKAS